MTMTLSKNQGQGFEKNGIHLQEIVLDPGQLVTIHILT